MHLRPPAIDHGVTSFLWALFFGLFIFIVGSVLGLQQAVALIVGIVAAFGIFLFIRIYGEDEPRRAGLRATQSEHQLAGEVTAQLLLELILDRRALPRPISGAVGQQAPGAPADVV